MNTLFINDSHQNNGRDFICVNRAQRALAVMHPIDGWKKFC